MAYNDAQNRATQKYINKNYDQISIRIPKGMRDIYKAHAESKNTSLNKLVIELLDKDMEGK